MKKKVFLVITGTILVDEDTEESDVDAFVDDVSGLGMAITEVETYDN
jgi:hypothetical protein